MATKSTSKSLPFYPTPSGKAPVLTTPAKTTVLPFYPTPTGKAPVLTPTKSSGGGGSSTVTSTSSSSSSSVPKVAIKSSGSSSGGSSYSSVSSKSTGSTNYSTPTSSSKKTVDKQNFTPYIGSWADLNKDAITTKTVAQPNFINQAGSFLSNLFKGLPSTVTGNQGASAFNSYNQQPVERVNTTLGMPTIANATPATLMKTKVGYGTEGAPMSQIDTTNSTLASSIPQTGYSETGAPYSAPAGTTPAITTPTVTPATKSVETLSSDGTQTVVNTTETPAVQQGTSPTITTNVTNKLGLLDKSITDRSNSAWDKNTTKADILNIANSNLSDIMKDYTDTTSFMNDYNTNPAVKQGVDNIINKTGLTLNDFTSKITPVKNGVTEPKTTADFLAYNKNIAKAETDLYNQSIAESQNWNQSQKDILLGKKDKDGKSIILGIAEQQKKDNEERLAYYERQEARAEANIREKAQYAIDKARAEFEVNDADTEIKRVNAKASLTEFLAKIGALRTDGNALTGLEKLEQAYQAQRQSLRNNFNLATREINMNMNDNINNLESALEEKKFTLSQDLSKTEREVMMESLKLDHEYKKDMLDYKIKYNDKIQSAKDKAETKALSYNSQYNDSLWKIMSNGNVPLDIAKTMINAKGDIMPTAANVDIMKTYATKKAPETEPKYTGETFKKQSEKEALKMATGLEDLGFSSFNLHQLSKDLAAGWSLEQIAKNSGMPTEVYNYLKDFIEVPSK